jgi:hypothetical protein
LPEALNAESETPADNQEDADKAETPSEPAAIKPAEPPAETATETAEDSGDAAEATDDAGTTDEQQPDDVQSERERITKENQRKIDERNDKIKKAEEKVQELNYRFADWYYVISEDVYKKIHLSRSDIIKETDEAKEKGSGIDAFRNIEEQGLEGTEEEESAEDSDPSDFNP